VYCGRTKQSRFNNQCKEVRSATASLLTNFPARFPLATTLLPVCDGQPQFDCFDPRDEIIEKINNLRIKILRKNPRYRFWIRKMLAYVPDNSEQRMMN
jgi:hypothetical protein